MDLDDPGTMEFTSDLKDLEITLALDGPSWLFETVFRLENACIVRNLVARVVYILMTLHYSSVRLIIRATLKLMV